MKCSVTIAATVGAVMALGVGATSTLAAPSYAALPAVQNDANIIQVASKKKYRRVHRGSAAGAAMLGVLGAVAAQDSYRHRYRYNDGYYYRGRGRAYNAPRYYNRPTNVPAVPSVQAPDGRSVPVGPNPYGTDR
jgi:hypothetical protein